MGRGRRVVVDERGRAASVRLVRGLAHERARQQASAERAERCRRHHDCRKRHAERVDRDERGGRHEPQHGMAQRAGADAPGRVQHDGDHRGLHAVQRGRDDRHVAVGDVEPRQRDQDDDRRQHEQAARDDAAPCAMHEPTDVRRELHGLGPGQQHAIVERVQEPAFRDPASLLHELAVHDGDLSRRPAEADAAEMQPIAEGLRPRGRTRQRRPAFAQAACRNVGAHRVLPSARRHHA
jgi:hypothetical protein